MLKGSCHTLRLRGERRVLERRVFSSFKIDKRRKDGGESLSLEHLVKMKEGERDCPEGTRGDAETGKSLNPVSADGQNGRKFQILIGNRTLDALDIGVTTGY
ncbi:hypothetical protein ElyMa_006233900 [Elysia marginata]|uniref:Uncharacterized protein n=1 Tax=Elysia marginata TaxID=1093978 RepID=A0AAV4H6B2_9GAST|nr:hypothetical protein ElyMa_006233900 [Elysia marginata]